MPTEREGTYWTVRGWDMDVIGKAKATDRYKFIVPVTIGALTLSERLYKPSPSYHPNVDPCYHPERHDSNNPNQELRDKENIEGVLEYCATDFSRFLDSCDDSFVDFVVWLSREQKIHQDLENPNNHQARFNPEHPLNGNHTHRMLTGSLTIVRAQSSSALLEVEPQISGGVVIPDINIFAYIGEGFDPITALLEPPASLAFDNVGASIDQALHLN